MAELKKILYSTITSAPEIPREQYLTRAILEFHAERYDEMLNLMHKLVLASERKFELTNTEILFLDGAFKIVYEKLILKMKENPEATSSIQAEIRVLCHTILGLLKSILLPFTLKTEQMAEYRRMLGDFNRYLSETARDSAIDGYKSVLEMTPEDLTLNHPTRLSTALNYARFIHDLAHTGHSTTEALGIAKQALKQARFDTSTRAKGKISEETYQLMVLLTHQISLWEPNQDPAAEAPLLQQPAAVQAPVVATTGQVLASAAAEQPSTATHLT